MTSALTTAAREASTKFWNALRWWSAPGLDLPLSMFRWAFGPIVILTYSYIVRDYDAFLSNHGMCARSEWVNTMPQYAFSFFRLTTSDTVNHAVALAGFVPMFLFWMGIFPRASALLSWYFIVSVEERCNIMMDAGNAVVRVMLFFFIFARSDRRLSPVSRLVVAQPTDSFPIRLMQVQVGLIYLTTFFQKLYGQKWVNGSALAYALHLQAFSRTDWKWLASQAWFINFGSYFTLAFEAVFILLVWPRSWRWFMLLSGFALHAGIETLMYIPLFAWIMLSTYFVFFYPEWGEKTLEFLLRPYATWARNHGYRALVPAGATSQALLRGLQRMDQFGAVQWESGEAGSPCRTLALESLKTGRRVEGLRAWLRLAWVVPSLLAWLPLWILPMGPKAMARTFQFLSGDKPSDSTVPQTSSLRPVAP